jgi:hypothetical protein
VARSRTDYAEDLVAPALHVLARAQRLEGQAQQRLGIRRPHVEVPVVVFDRQAVQPVLPSIGIPGCELFDPGVLIVDF